MRRKVDASAERLIITGMVVSDKVLKELRPLHNSLLYKTNYARMVAGWCCDYYDKYEKAPGQQIEAIYNREAETTLDPDTAEMIGAFLGSISDSYANRNGFNADYCIDTGEKHFKSQSLLNLAAGIKLVAEDDPTEGEKLLADYVRVERPRGDGINPFSDEQAWENAFDLERNELFRLPGAIGEMIRIERDSFIAFLGSTGRGKSWILMEIALRAFRARLSVAYFITGDMSQNQVLRRLGVRLTSKHYLTRYQGEYLHPVYDCERNQSGTCQLRQRRGTGLISEAVGSKPKDLVKANPEWMPCNYCRRRKPEEYSGAVWWEKKVEKELTAVDAYLVASQWLKRARSGKFRMACYPAKSATVNTLEKQIDLWEEFEDVTPDLIIVDYADIMSAGKTKYDAFRHGEDEKWARLRGLAEKRHCCVITATQADAKSYESKKLTLGNFSEDRRKHDHVTAEFALNQTWEEKEKGLLRIGELKVRDEEFSINRQVTVMQSFRTGESMVGSWMEGK